MDELATQLIQLRTGETGNSNLPTAIFGTAGQLSRYIDQRERIRIGLWPIVSDSQPETAMGIAVILAFLLERWTDIRVYQLFVSVDGEPTDDYEWDMSQSQFEVDDWELDPLDENVAIWGNLRQEDSKYTLEIDVENDLLDDREEKTFTVESLDLAGIIHSLPQLSRDIAEYLDSAGTVVDAFEESSATDEVISDLLATLFTIQRRLFLFLWGIEYTVAELEADFNTLIAKSSQLPGDLCAWIVSNTIAHAMQPGYEELSDFSAATANYVIDSFPDEAFPFAYLSSALFRQGKVNEAFEMSKNGVSQHPHYAAGWRVYAEMYRVAGRFREAVDVYQQAIENDVEEASLFRRYGSAIEALDAEGLQLDEFILIDPDAHLANLSENFDNLTFREAIAAYDEVLAEEPDDLLTLQKKVFLLVELYEKEPLWTAFKALVDLDESGDRVREVADSMYNIENLQPLIDILSEEFKNKPERYDLLVNMAILNLHLEDGDAAYEMLEKAGELTDDPDIQSDIQRLMLTADNPEFEARLAEIRSMVEAGNSANDDDLDFIENAIEAAPLLSELYVVAAHAYINWEESGDAMDTLLDGVKENPNDPEIVELLAQLLWDAEQYDLAFDYLNKAVEEHPNNVPLLALTGQFLAENDQREEARTYLLRAEAIAPTHPALRQARQNISQMHSE